SAREIQLVTEMMEILTDPRIAAGSGPFAHPSLKLPLADGSHLQMRASDDPEALADTMPGLSYVHVAVDGTTTAAPAVAPAAGDAAAPAGDGAAAANNDAAAGNNDGDAGKKNRRSRSRRRNRSR
ncbi:MAG: hypothetical protein ACPHL6_09860, partial [Rubripirellula sp.]